MSVEVPPSVDTFLGALRDPSDDTAAAARAVLADDVEVFSPFGLGTGVDTGAAMLANPRVLGLLRDASWSEPEADGDMVAVTATPNGPAAIRGFRFAFAVQGDGRINRIEHDMLPGASGQATPAPLALTDAQAELLSNALTNGTTPIVAYVDAAGVPHQSYRATVQVLDEQRLGVWIRDPNGGLPRALATNPALSIFYADRANGVTLQFVGRAHIDSDEAMRVRIHEGSPKFERDLDWRRNGLAVVVDVDRVEGRDSSGPVLMAR